MYSGDLIALISLVLEQIVLRTPSLGMVLPGRRAGSGWDELGSSICREHMQGSIPITGSQLQLRAALLNTLFLFFLDSFIVGCACCCGLRYSKHFNYSTSIK